jgi:hypothetical protein
MPTTEPEFTDGMTKIASNWSAMSDAAKVEAFQSTNSAEEPTLNDLSKICPFVGHMYYED